MPMPGFIIYGAATAAYLEFQGVGPRGRKHHSQSSGPAHQQEKAKLRAPRAIARASAIQTIHLHGPATGPSNMAA